MISFNMEVNPFIILQIIIFVLQLHLASYIYDKYKAVKKFKKDLRAMRYELDYYKERYGLGKTDEEQDREDNDDDGAAATADNKEP